ncbi:Germin-like protein subfamily 1 member 16 [Striga hermonthica]|uniref:Germin-like protein n=1 Tax=Striga hermonthica TaxID=68872 RepID=A0A9N7RPP9_STRHE|nr:Germin-like protein subfamily 1 member 16 [Striga hermonthica]
MSSAKTMLLVIIVVTVVSLYADAYDPEPLQDFCVGVSDKDATVFVNGKICKNPNTVTADDFYFSGLNRPGNITNPFGTVVTKVFVDEMPALNTLGVAVTRIDYNPHGANPPHSHPHASEILMVMEGTLYAGFISTNPANPYDKNKLYAKVLGPGDLYVVPKGLVHFQYNLGNTKALAFACFSSQKPGLVTISKAIFGSEPLVHPDLLAKSFQMSRKEVDRLLSLEWIGNSLPQRG